MPSVLLRSAVVTAFSVIVSSIAVGVAIPLFGEKPMPSAFWLSKIIPLAVSFPIAFLIFRQSEHITKLNSELAKAYQELSVLYSNLAESSRFDGMTRVFNRDSFLKVAEELHPNGTVLLIDADHFKRINDQYGHAAGDAALVAIAGAIRGQLRGRDIVGRLGGEEFGVFLHGVGAVEADAIAERIREAVFAIEFRPCEEGLHQLSVSIGGVNAGCESGLQTVLRAADRLLYKAKSQGRNCVVLNAA